MTALDYGGDVDRERYLLICIALLRDVQKMRAEVNGWPPSERKNAAWLATQLQVVDERIHQLVQDLASTAH